MVALAAVRVDGGVVRADDTFDALINPGRRIPELATSWRSISASCARRLKMPASSSSH